MEKNNSKPVNVLDPAVLEFLVMLERQYANLQLPEKLRIKKQRQKEMIQSRKESRTTYDLNPRVRKVIRSLAAYEGIPASQMVNLALLIFLKGYRSGAIDLDQYKQPSLSPKYDWNLSISNKYINEILKSYEVVDDEKDNT